MGPMALDKTPTKGINRKCVNMGKMPCASLLLPPQAVAAACRCWGALRCMDSLEK
jgi:hypothetical protein